MDWLEKRKIKRMFKKKDTTWNKNHIPEKEHIPFDPTVEEVYDPINPPPNLRGIISGGLDEKTKKDIYKKRLLRGETEKSANGGLNIGKKRKRAKK